MLLRVRELLIKHRVGVARGLPHGFEVLPARLQVTVDLTFRPYRRMILLIQTENHMAKAVARGTKGAGRMAARSVRRGRAGWVRKNVVMDQRKRDVARRALGVDTETEAIDQALDFVAFREELAKGFTAVRRSGVVDDVLESRRKA